MPKVVMVNTVCSGSHGRIMGDLSLAAAQAGFQATLAYGRGGAATDTAICIDTQTDVLAHVALTRLLDRHAQGSKKATRAFVSLLETMRPDLLHLHNIHGYYLHAQTLFDYIRRTGIPAVWTHHDCWALTGHCSHFVRASCMRWQTGCHSCPLKHAYPASYGLDASRANWHWKKEAFATAPSVRIVAPSQWLSGVIGESFLVDVPRQVIPNGVDTLLFRPGGDERLRAQHGVKPGQAMLLAVASPFDERKGYADMLRLAERLQSEARVILVGLTDKQLAALPPYVAGIARTDGPEALVALYGEADCLVNTTYEDTYPTVNMEAMACGTPVACYAVGGATEQLQAPHGTGVPVGDIDALGGAALSLARQKPALTAGCRQYAQAHFDRRAALAAYIKLYRSMTGE